MFGSSNQNTTPAFGSSTTTSAFGGSSAFGRTTSAFGGPASTPFGGGGGGTTTAGPSFGAAPSPSPFGVVQQPQQGGFGGGGGFGSQQQQQQPTFGSSSFGAPSTTTFAFGSPPPAAQQQQQPSIFGSSGTTTTTSPFGGGSLFGSAPTAGTTSSPFGGGGGGAPSPAFGVPTTAAGGGLFGSTTTSTPLFGSTPSSTSAGLFGGGATATPTTAFGAAAPTPSFFGSTPTATSLTSTTTGTSAVPYSVTRKQDGQTMVTMKAITAMPAYENKSFEELRLEDYMAGNRGTAAAAAAPSTGFGGGFGSTTPFGAAAPQPTSLFGAPAPSTTTTGLFGSAPATFGTTSAFGGTPTTAGTFGGFGSPPAAAAAPSTTGFTFGAAPAPSTTTTGFSFGSTTTAAPAPTTTGLFGAPAPSTTGLFGSTAPAPSTGGLFGSTTTSLSTGGGLFGGGGGATSTTPTMGGGLFGSSAAPAPAFSTGGFFGSPAPAPTFGSTTTTSAFGAPAPTPATAFGGGGGGLFGSAPAPTASVGLFGSSTAAAPPAGGFFGSSAAPAPSGGLFGTPAPAPTTGFFGSTAAAPTPGGGGLFGGASTTAPAPTTTTGLFGSTTGLFGSSAAPTPAPTSSLFGGGGGLFGTPAPTGTTPGLWAAPTSMMAPPTGEALLAQRLAAIEEQKRELAMLESWSGGGGGSPLTSSRNGHGIVLPASLVERPSGTSAYSPTTADALLLRSSAAARSTTRIRPRGFSSQVRTPPELKQLGDASTSPIFSPGMALFGSSATKRLVIQPGSLSKGAKPKVRLQLTNGDSTHLAINGLHVENGLGSTTSKKESSPLNDRSTPQHVTPRRIHEEESAEKHIDDSFTLKSPLPDHASTVFSPTPPSDTANKSFDLYKRVIASPGDVKSPAAIAPSSSDVLPKLTKEGYTVSPSLAELAKMSEADLAAVSNFVVSRPGYGSVAWEGAVDVRGVDLDVVVVIEDKEVAVYDEYEEHTGFIKPPVGSKLNRPAIITLEHVFPSDRSNQEIGKKFERKVAKQTAKMGADLLSYDTSTGVWKFRTHHFSRYGLVADDDDESEEEGVNESALPPPKFADTKSTTSTMLSLIPGSAKYFDEVSLIIHEKQKSPSTRFLIWEEDEPGNYMEDDDFMAINRRKTLTSITEEQTKLDAADSAYNLIISEAERLEQALRASRSRAMIERVSKICRGEDIMNEFQEEAKLTVDSSVIPRKVSDSLTLIRPTDYAHAEAAPRKVTDISTLLRTTDGGPSGSISTFLATTCNIKAFTSSRIDYGMRMGRSFRVAWRPDGSFVQPDPGHIEVTGVQSNLSGRWINVSTRLLVRKPDFQEDSKNYDLTSLLDVHWKNSVPLCSVKNCPIYSLPSIVGEDNASYKALCQAIEDYAGATKPSNQEKRSGATKDPEVDLVAHRSFSLLSALYGQETGAFEKSELSFLPLRNNHSSSLLHSERRRQGLLLWLREACAYTMQQSVSAAQRIGDDDDAASAAIFAALSGGDINLACSLATENRFLRLSTLLSMFDSRNEFRDLMRQQLHQWGRSGFDTHMSLYMKRIYSLLSGSLEIERQLHDSLDWRRRLCLHLLFTSGTDICVDDEIREFDADVRAELAPYPLPRYTENEKQITAAGPAHRCVLYNLLCMRVDGGRCKDIGVSVATALSPLGYTSSQHDFSLSFHISACVRALQCAPNLSPFEIATLKESLCAQLLCDGLWHWAVYVMLCDGGELDNHDYAVTSARNLVVQHYQEKDGNEKRRFLEDEIGVPSIWFEEALAMRCGFEGKEIEHIRHSIACSHFDEACRATEELVIPRALLNGGEEATRLLNFLRILKENSLEMHSSRWCSVNGCGAFLQLLELSESVTNLVDRSRIDPSFVVPHEKAHELILVVDELRKLFHIPSDDSNHVSAAGYWACRRNYAMKDCLKNVAILSACNRLSLLRLQLTSLLCDIPIRLTDADFTLRSKIAT